MKRGFAAGDSPGSGRGHDRMSVAAPTLKSEKTTRWCAGRDRFGVLKLGVEVARLAVELRLNFFQGFLCYATVGTGSRAFF